MEIRFEQYLTMSPLGTDHSNPNIDVFAGLRVDDCFKLDFINLFQDGSWIAKTVFETEESFLEILNNRTLSKDQKYQTILQSILASYLLFVKSRGDDANKS